MILNEGLDPILLPIKLNLMHEDLRLSIESYRNLVNEMYNCAVQNLRGALHSNPPQIAALLPLIQLLLLGDRVKDAADELEKSCIVLNNSAEPFRLRAKLMESFAKNQTSIISSCCEEVLKRDSTCSYSIKTLIRLHKKGDYNTNNLLEMLANHIETVDDCGPNIWEELAICFLNLVNASNTCNYEDNVSINMKRGLDSIFSSSKKIPELFCDGKILGTWKIRHRWWLNIHFSGKNILSESQSGDYRLLTRKAACACHIYRPEFDYVIKVHEMLQKQGMNDEILFLRVHMKNPLSEFLNLGS
ncbi:hypothetical protein LUZ60_008669 [Juncus effusus]|nr:hypothetical protein LUZ60_008669 [Juncus effusus]